jgi:hypothetical protein
LRWSIPRELLWAIIGSLAICVIVLWPTKYPYSQAPKIDTQQESAKGIGGGNEAKHTPTGLKEPAGDEDKRDGSKHAQDAEIWGVKRGEWLLFLATLGLWYATWRLVRGADKTAERQLRAYVHVGEFGWKAFRRTGAPWGPDTGWGFWLPYENFGATPARDVISHISYDTFLPFDGDLPSDFSFAPVGEPGAGGGLIGPKGRIVSDLLEIESNLLDAAASHQTRLFVFGYVSYRDVFEGAPERRTEFCYELDRVLGDPYLIPSSSDDEGAIFFHFRLCGRYNRIDEDCEKEYS